MFDSFPDLTLCRPELDGQLVNAYLRKKPLNIKLFFFRCLASCDCWNHSCQLCNLSIFKTVSHDKGPQKPINPFPVQGLSHLITFTNSCKKKFYSICILHVFTCTIRMPSVEHLFVFKAGIELDFTSHPHVGFTTPNAGICDQHSGTCHTNLFKCYYDNLVSFTDPFLITAFFSFSFFFFWLSTSERKHCCGQLIFELALCEKTPC